MSADELDDLSVISGAETASSSGLENCDVAIFCSNVISPQVREAEQILDLTHDLKICISSRDSPASRPELANLYSVANHSRFRVFLITEDFLRRDFKLHLRLLENEVCTKQNSLLLLQRPSYRQRIPNHLGDLTCKSMEGRISAEVIVREIIDFRNSQLVREDSAGSNFDGDASTSDEYQPLDRKAIENRRKERVDLAEKEYSRFQDLFGKITKKKCYILISSPIRDHSPSLSYVTCIPWVRVFDFDTRSSTDGLYLWAQEKLSTRNYVKTDKIEQIEPPDDDTINWVSITCDSDGADSEHVRDAAVSENAILRHGESLADHCVGRKIPIILVMWYPRSSNLDNTLDGFLTGMRHHLKGRLNCFECIVCVEQMPNKRTPLYRTLQRLGIINTVIEVPVGTLCDWMKECSEQNDDVANSCPGTKTLPKFSEDENEDSSVEIAEETLSWIRSLVFVLVKTEGVPAILDRASDALEYLGTSFLKGCRIHWDVLESGRYDVERDILEKVKSYIESKHISTGRSGLITIFHAPGGGGTTFARRLLHELRNRVPCGELVSERFSLKNLEEILTALRNSTFLPTVLLLDGNSMHDVKRISGLAIDAKVRVILIHVRRFISEADGLPVSSDNKFFLSAKVSAVESEKFVEVYSKAAPKKDNALKKLSRQSINGNHRHIFEYGMTAFQSGFVGVRKYVHGYLQLHDMEPISNWHTVLLFLSLANYYGHRGLPCKLFSKLLGKEDNEMVDLEDLPHAAQQFITEENESWKITHFVVSKLIIEQVLVRRKTTDFECPESKLSPEACNELSRWALMFIDNVIEYVGVTKNLASHVHEILTSIFIRRNYDDPGEDETVGYKTQFSKFIEEIHKTNEQEDIFLKLVKGFPGQAEFKAHLGRFYSKQRQFEKADECFKEAIEARRQELRWTNGYVAGSDTPKPDDVMQRIYNMTGFACISSIRSRIGSKMGKLTPRVLKNKNQPQLIRFCLEKASQAIRSFETGRLYYQKSSNPSFANIGELKVRLQLSELAKLVGNDDFASLLENPSPYRELAQFALQSFHECDRLLAECIADRSKDLDIPEKEINFCFNNYNFFFKNATEALKKWAGKDTSVHSMQCHLSILKAKLKQDSKRGKGRRHFKFDEDVRSAEDVSTLVGLYESICDAVWKNRSNTRISGYMTEWLKAVRHPCVATIYSQTDVLTRVEKWNDKKETGSLSRFYCYLLSTTICISSLSTELANVYAEKSRKLYEDIKHRDNRPTYGPDSAEWLGNSPNQDYFNKLIHFSELGDWNGKFWTNREAKSKLQVCSGNIQYCRPHDGIIMLDVDGDRNAKIAVFFVPNKYDIGMSHSRKRTRVEFYLAFNTRHLAEAYEVTLLKTFPCPDPNCKMPTEISTLGKDPREWFAICNKCEKEVRITTNG